MTALTQYIKAVLENLELVNAGSAPLLNRQRQQALDALRTISLPQALEAPLAPDYGLNFNRIAIPTDVSRTFRCDIPNITTLLALNVNDRFTPTDTLVKNKPEGLTICSLCEAAATRPELLERYLGKNADTSSAVDMLAEATAQDGVFIHIARGLKVEHPIQLVNILNSPRPMLLGRRIVIVAEEDSRADIVVCDHTQAAPDVEMASVNLTEIYLQPGATLSLADLEEATPATRRLHSLRVSQTDRSAFKSTSVTLNNGFTDNALTVNIDGRDAEARISAMVIARGNSRVANHSSVNHMAPHSSSSQLFKYLLDDSAAGVFDGRIYVDRNAPFTNAFQNNRNIIASAGARMHTEPTLLIYNDDVKCSHGAATGQLDPDALFYMAARGIPQREAKAMLMHAFLTDTLADVAIENLRLRLSMLAEKALGGGAASCADCSLNCL